MTTTLRDAAQAALDTWDEWHLRTDVGSLTRAMNDLRTALAAEQAQEPVACPHGCTTQEEHDAHPAPAQEPDDDSYAHVPLKVVARYTLHPAPAQTPMSEEQADALLKDQWLSNDSTWYSLIRAIERHHGIGGKE